MTGKIEFGWTYRNVETARTRITLLQSGRTSVQMDHAPLHGVSSEMVLWWPRNFCDVDVVVGGIRVACFVLGHPKDHIALDRLTGVAGDPLKQGDEIRVIEAYQNDAKHSVDERLEIRLCTDELFEVSVVGQGFTSGAVYRFRDTPYGGVAKVEVTIGNATGILKSILKNGFTSWTLKEERDLAWIRHAVEEIGCFERFLSQVYAARGQSNVIHLSGLGRS